MNVKTMDTTKRKNVNKTNKQTKTKKQTQTGKNAKNKSNYITGHETIMKPTQIWTPPRSTSHEQDKGENNYKNVKTMDTTIKTKRNNGYDKKTNVNNDTDAKASILKGSGTEE